MTAKRWQPSEAEMKRFIREFFKYWAHLEGIEARALIPRTVRSDQDLGSILAQYAQAVGTPSR